MAAPDGAITSMQTAVQGQSARYDARTAPSVILAPPPRIAAADMGGPESDLLARLRDEVSRERGDGAACELSRPTHSRAPRYETRREGDLPEVDDLDTATDTALSRLQLPDLRGSITKRTLKYVRFFSRTDKGRGMFETWMKRSGRYQDMVQAELRERRLPEDLIWVAMIESGFDPRARSPAGAVGLWQFMPATGAVYGLTQSSAMDQRKNPRLATQAAAHHLRDLYARFGHWDLALAAYNMGYEQLLRAIDRFGTSDFNELSRQEAIPSETAAYVPKIMAAAIVANNLDHFGFDKVEVSRPVDGAEIAVPPGTPLKALAKAAGVSTATVRTLNPDILGERVPNGRGDFLLMIPSDTLARARASLPALVDSDQTGVEDVLDPVDLMGNTRQPRRSLGRGEDESLLSLLPPPKKRRSLRDSLDEERDDRDEDLDLVERPKARKGRETVMYKVGPGDTLLGVARQFAVDIDDLASDNGLETDSKLREGALIRLRVRKDVLDRTSKNDGPAAEREAAPPKAEPQGKADAPRRPEPAPEKKPGSKRAG
jgi:membrane-bound lytic murein transglycosylase D